MPRIFAASPSSLDPRTINPAFCHYFLSSDLITVTVTLTVDSVEQFRSLASIIEHPRSKKFVRTTNGSTFIIMATAEQQGMSVVSTSRVALLGLILILVGMVGFYSIPGLINQYASGSKVINAFYCSVITLTTIGFGDICPGDPDIEGRIFLTVFPLIGLGFFCGPILVLASSWRKQVPGGPITLAVFALGMGVSMFTAIENFSITEALHFCVVLGTTIGYGDITPKSDEGRLMVAIYALLILNVMAGLLDVGREYLESLCRTTTPAVITETNISSKKEKTTSGTKQVKAKREKAA